MSKTSDIRLECCDNREFLRSIGNDSVQLVVTSPPYNLGKSYERKSSMEDHLRNQSEVIGECIRICAPNGSICWQVGNHVDRGEIYPLDILLYPIFKNFGMHLRNRIVWHYAHGLHCTKRLSGRHEIILWWTKSNDYIFHLDPIRVPSKYPNKRYFRGPRAGQLSGNPLGKNPGDVWLIPNVKHNHVEKTIHPCQFPVELVERLVLALTEPEDVVVDPYMGVGSTIVAAVKNDRQGWGCDTVPEYVKIAEQRLRDCRSGILRTRPMDRPIYEPKKIAT